MTGADLALFLFFPSITELEAKIYHRAGGKNLLGYPKLLKRHFSYEGNEPLLQQPLKVGERMLSDGDLCELTQIGDDVI